MSSFLKTNTYLVVVLGLILSLPIVDALYPAKIEGTSRLVPVVAKFSLLLLLAFFFFRKLKQWWFNNPIGGIITAFMLIHIGYLLFTSDEHLQDFYKLSKTLVWYFGFFFFLHVGFYRQINDTRRNWFFGLATFFILFLVIVTITNEALFKSNRDYASSNQAYYLLFIMPFLFMQSKIRLRAVLFMAMTIGVAISLKRGTMLMFALMVGYLLFFSNLRQIAGKRFAKLFRIVIVLVIIVVVRELVLNNFDIYADKFSDISEAQSANVYRVGSGRGALYLLPLERWITSNPIHFLFGYGFNATPDFYPTTGILSNNFYAHSDFVMLIHDYGFLGLVLLFIFFKRLFKLARATTLKTIQVPLVLISIALFIKALFSGFINYDYSIFGFAILGLILGEQRRLYLEHKYSINDN